MSCGAAHARFSTRLVTYRPGGGMPSARPSMAGIRLVAKGPHQTDRGLVVRLDMRSIKLYTLSSYRVTATPQEESWQHSFVGSRFVS